MCAKNASVGETELAKANTARLFSGTKNKSDLVGMNEIVDAVVMHKISPKLNILSANLKTNEIEAEKFDSFVANEILKPASDYSE